MCLFRRRGNTLVPERTVMRASWRWPCTVVAVTPSQYFVPEPSKRTSLWASVLVT